METEENDEESNLETTYCDKVCEMPSMYGVNRKDPARVPWHGYDYPEYGRKDRVRYRFDWVFFGEAAVYFPLTGDYNPSISCLFSRAELDDTVLLFHEDYEEALDFFNDKVRERLAAIGRAPAGNSEGLESEKENEGDSEDEIVQQMAALHLPTSFGSKKSRREKNASAAKRRRSYQKLPYFDTLTDYYNSNMEYLHRKSWLHDYPAYFDSVEEAEEYDYLTDRRYFPRALLKEHKKVEYFYGISYPEDDPDFPRRVRTDEEWEDLKTRHWYTVGDRVRDDYRKYQEYSKAQRLSSFKSMLKQVGLAYGKKKNVSASPSLDQAIGGVTQKNGAKDGKKDKSDDDRKDCPYPKWLLPPDTTFVDIQYDFRVPCDYFHMGYRTKKKRQSSKMVSANPKSESPDTEQSSPSCEHLQEESTEEQGWIKTGEFDVQGDIMKTQFQLVCCSDGKCDKCLLAKNALKKFPGDKEFLKYYHQRFRLFSKINEGILMDREGWYSVTPERIAEHIADRVVLKKDALVLDGFAGVGGNSIQFALKGAYVIALDMDPLRLHCAKRNAEIYGVADRITFICTDYFHFCKHTCAKVRGYKLRIRNKRDAILRSCGYDVSKWRKKKKADVVDFDKKNPEGEFEVIKKLELESEKKTEDETNDKEDKRTDEEEGHRTDDEEDEETNDEEDEETDDQDDEETDDQDDDLGMAIDDYYYKPVFDAVFLSPPWGGPAYRDSKVFSLSDMEPDGQKIFAAARKMTHNIAYYLPKQTDTKELMILANNAGREVEIEQAQLNGKVKAITAYYGELSCHPNW